jgi:glycine/D-amino acid oxidase-like deaminating enzyme
VAVVGGGVAGLSCARALAAEGVVVAVFDKGRAPGGRISTRRAPPHAFDLGAQYCTARDARFMARARAWGEAGVAAQRTGRIVALEGPRAAFRSIQPIERLVGTPDMSALARSLAAGLDVGAGHRVEAIAREGGSFVLRGTIAPPGVTLGPLAGGQPPSAELGRHVASSAVAGSARLEQARSSAWGAMGAARVGGVVARCRRRYRARGRRRDARGVRVDVRRASCAIERELEKP